MIRILLSTRLGERRMTQSDLARVTGIRSQTINELYHDFAERVNLGIRVNDCFYIDKTMFIKEWWEKNDDVTLIIRPRRFGKTLNMDMLNCFFLNKFAERDDLFEGLEI